MHVCETGGCVMKCGRNKAEQVGRNLNNFIDISLWLTYLLCNEALKFELNIKNMCF